MGTEKKYRDNILDPTGLRKEFPSIAASLAKNSFSHGEHFEKLHTAKNKVAVIRSIRTSLRARMLVTNKVFNNKSYWIMLAHLPDHEYQGHPLLQRNGLKNYYQKNMSKLLEQVTELEFLEETRQVAIAAFSPVLSPSSSFTSSSASSAKTPVPVNPAEEKNIETINETTNEENEENENEEAIIEELVYFNKQLMTLNQKEKEAVEAQQPLLINGMPGTGKTCVAMTRLLNALEIASEEKETERVLYVTASKKLTQKMRKMREKSPSFDPKDSNVIEFKTYTELLHELAPETKDKKLAEKNYFTTWIATWLKRNSDFEVQLKRCLPKDSDLADSLYQECRFMTGLKDEKNKKLGDRQTLFSSDDLSPAKEIEFREKLYSVLTEYREYLRLNDSIDPAFFELTNVPEIIYQMVIDEAQDLSPLQLNVLARSTKTRTIAKYLPLESGAQQRPTQKNISIFLDPFQSLNDDLSKVPALKKIFGKELAQLELTESLRCSKRVIKVANAILKMRRDITGGIPDKNLSDKMTAADNAAKGDAIWIDTPTEEEQKHIDGLIKSHKCAVITWPEFIAEARIKFPGAQILTIAEAKGLEFETVIAYRLLENPRYFPINTLLSHPQKNANTTTGRAKKDKANNQYGSDLNSLFTAVTRARTSLIIHNNSPDNALKNKTRHIRTLLEGATPRAKKKNTPISAILPESSQKDWLKTIKEHLTEHNNITVAWDLYSKHIINDRKKFSEFAESLRKKNDTTHDTEMKTSMNNEEREMTQLISLSDNKFREKILNILDRPDPDTILCLFKVCIEGNLLFLHISGNKAQFDILLDIFRQTEYAKKITMAQLRTLIKYEDFYLEIFHFILLNKQGSKLWTTLAENNPQILCDLTRLDMVKIIQHPGLENISVLHLHCRYIEIIKTLSQLILKNPDLVSQLTADSFLLPGQINIKKNKQHALSEASENEQKKRPIDYLITSAEGNFILEKLINKIYGLHYELIKTVHDNSNLEFTMLCFSVDKSSNLLRALVANSHYLKKNIYTFLNKKIENSITSNNFTALHQLALTRDGCELLLYFLNINPELANQLKLDDLCSPVKCPHHETKMTYSVLREHNTGREVLKKIFGLNPLLKKEILSKYQKISTTNTPQALFHQPQSTPTQGTPVQSNQPIVPPAPKESTEPRQGRR